MAPATGRFAASCLRRERSARKSQGVAHQDRRRDQHQQHSPDHPVAVPRRERQRGRPDAGDPLIDRDPARLPLTRRLKGGQRSGECEERGDGERTGDHRHGEQPEPHHAEAHAGALRHLTAADTCVITAIGVANIAQQDPPETGGSTATSSPAPTASGALGRRHRSPRLRRCAAPPRIRRRSADGGVEHLTHGGAGDLVVADSGALAGLGEHPQRRHPMSVVRWARPTVGSVTRLLLVRHGQSTWNAQGRWQGQEDPPLTDVGSPSGSRWRRRRSAPSTPCSVRRSSAPGSLPRSSPSRSASARSVALGGLIERHAGEWQGLRRDEIDEMYPGYLDEGHAGPRRGRPTRSCTHALSTASDSIVGALGGGRGHDRRGRHPWRGHLPGGAAPRGNVRTAREPRCSLDRDDRRPVGVGRPYGPAQRGRRHDSGADMNRPSSSS